MFSSRNNVTIYNLSIVSDGKVNLVGALERPNYEIHGTLQKRLKK